MKPEQERLQAQIAFLREALGSAHSSSDSDVQRLIEDAFAKSDYAEEHNVNVTDVQWCSYCCKPYFAPDLAQVLYHATVPHRALPEPHGLPLGRRIDGSTS